MGKIRSPTGWIRFSTCTEIFILCSLPGQQGKIDARHAGKGILGKKNSETKWKLQER